VRDNTNFLYGLGGLGRNPFKWTRRRTLENEIINNRGCGAFTGKGLVTKVKKGKQTD